MRLNLKWIYFCPNLPFPPFQSMPFMFASMSKDLVDGAGRLRAIINPLSEKFLPEENCWRKFNWLSLGTRNESKQERKLLSRLSGMMSF